MGAREPNLREPCIYIMANKRHGTIYTGVTSNLARRVHEHRTDRIQGFPSRYQCHFLVYYEYYPRMDEAITREKQIKAGSRQKKIALIESLNPDSRDLHNDLT